MNAKASTLSELCIAITSKTSYPFDYTIALAINSKRAPKITAMTMSHAPCLPFVADTCH